MDNEILNLLKSMQSDIKAMQSDIKSIHSDMKTMDNKIDKSTVMLEELNSKTEIVVEVLKNHIAENEKQHKEIIIPIKEKINVIELATKSTSKDMHELNEKFDKVEKVTMQNTYDVAYLKMAK